MIGPPSNGDWALSRCQPHAPPDCLPPGPQLVVVRALAQRHAAAVVHDQCLTVRPERDGPKTPPPHDLVCRFRSFRLGVVQPPVDPADGQLASPATPGMA